MQRLGYPENLPADGVSKRGQQVWSAGMASGDLLHARRLQDGLIKHRICDASGDVSDPEVPCSMKVADVLTRCLSEKMSASDNFSLFPSVKARRNRRPPSAIEGRCGHR